MIQRWKSYDKSYILPNNHEVDFVKYDDHVAEIEAEKQKVEDLANTIERLMLHAELRADGLYHIRFTAEAYEALAGLHARYLEGRR